MSLRIPRIDFFFKMPVHFNLHLFDFADNVFLSIKQYSTIYDI